ncbi:hypothetical protein [Paenibacillus kobensis]|uniref:hypothetical protein n=1 Tax=Paenibacillus kobensis TaxID=59841 RepID=UPI000FDA5562|nr:hypothetical protein [Paenibacillus kobensis]
MKTRYFNNLTVHSGGMHVTKTSEHVRKLIDEIIWYLDCPDELKSYMPTVQSFSLDRKFPSLTIDFIAGNTLGDALVAGNWTRREWDVAFRGLRRTLNDFKRFPGHLSKACLYDMYVSKTHERMNAFLHQCDWAKQVHSQGYLRLNGRTVLSPTVMLQKELGELLKLLEEPVISAMHGDFCLSNLFYSIETDSIKMIDPRGCFGVRTIYGDHRYDWAKLRHSLSGYEHIIRGKYKVKVETGAIELELGLDRETDRLRNMLDSWIGPDQLKKVRIIEALLFLSMLPLHKEESNRQLALFALGTERLEQALSE